MRRQGPGSSRARSCASGVAALALFWLVAEPAVGSVAFAARAAQPAGDTQVQQAGQVTVAVTWLGGGEELAIRVVLDTHILDLDQYDLTRLAVVRTDQGTEVAATGWDAPAGVHHREGTLRFPAMTENGTALLAAETRGLELLIRDVAGIPERRFAWTW